MSEVILKSYDLAIAKLPSGDEVVKIRPSLAFSPSFIKEMRSLGVEEEIKKNSHEEDEE